MKQLVTVQESYSYCEEVIKIHSKTFYKAFSFLPEEKRRAVWAVYSFCRTVDDIVDEGERPLEELAIFKVQFQQFLKGNSCIQTNVDRTAACFSAVRDG